MRSTETVSVEEAHGEFLELVRLREGAGNLRELLYGGLVDIPYNGSHQRIEFLVVASIPPRHWFVATPKFFFGYVDGIQTFRKKRRLP